VLSLTYDPDTSLLTALLNDGGAFDAGTDMESIQSSEDSADMYFEVLSAATDAAVFFAGAVAEDYNYSVPVGSGILYQCEDPLYRFQDNL